jgi:sugar-phosphatase
MTFVLDCEGVLFDLDGVLVDSGPSVEFVWSRWATEQGMDPSAALAIVHGRRTADTVRALRPDADIDAEVRRLEDWEVDDAHRVQPAPGVLALLASLPPDRWGIVTSGTVRLASARLGQAGVPIPKVFVTAHDVREGKPAPECYLLGAKRLGVEPTRCAVIEDAPAGIRAGRSAGATVIGVATTHDIGELSEANHRLPNLTHLRAEPAGGKIRLIGN